MKAEKLYLPRRLRRLRRTDSLRALSTETTLCADDLIMPLFVIDRNGSPEAIHSMPGQYRYPIDDLLRECEQLFCLGIKAVALFPVIDEALKDTEGSNALREDSLLLKAVICLKKALPDLVVITDIALDPYTTHGHDGLLNAAQTDVDNDRTVAVLAQMAYLQAQAGADIVAPSDMMDGRVGAIRESLDNAGFDQTIILSYAAKFVSNYYNPFRDALGAEGLAINALKDKKTYQLNCANSREALLEAQLDEDEGADLLMVKPAGPYLDIIARLRQQTLLPVVAYQVSGEYAQIHAASQLGWLDLDAVRDESLIGIKRAGTDLIITYFAKDWLSAHKR